MTLHTPPAWSRTSTAFKEHHEQTAFLLQNTGRGAGPCRKRVIQTLAIPRGQIAMAAGHCKPDARRFDLSCDAESPYWGTCSNPFLHQAFRTVRYTITVIVHDDGTWSYEQDTVLRIQGRDDEFHHTDRNTLRRIAAPTPNPLMRHLG